MTHPASTDQPTCIVMIDDIVWTPGREIDEAVRHLSTRFARSTPLDADAVLGAASSVAERMRMLGDWAEAAGVSLDRELGRFLDEHLSMFVRPDSSRARAVRGLASTHRIVAASALPPRAATSIALHAGVGRAIAAYEGDVLSSDHLTRIIAQSDAKLVIAASGAAQLDGLDRRAGVEFRDSLQSPVSH